MAVVKLSKKEISDERLEEILNLGEDIGLDEGETIDDVVYGISCQTR